MKRNTHKVCKKHVNFPKSEGKICKSRGEVIIFAKYGGSSEIQNLWSMTKKVIRDFGGRKSKNLSGKGNILETNFPESEKLRNLSKIGGKSETWGNASLPQRVWTPLYDNRSEE